MPPPPPSSNVPSLLLWHQSLQIKWIFTVLSIPKATFGNYRIYISVSFLDCLKYFLSKVQKFWFYWEKMREETHWGGQLLQNSYQRRSHLWQQPELKLIGHSEVIERDVYAASCRYAWLLTVGLRHQEKMEWKQYFYQSGILL